MIQRIFITGSSRGIGAEIARLAYKEGYEVIVHGKTDSERLQKLSLELKCQKIIFDLNDKDAVRESVKDLGSLNVLINSAGINISKPFLELDRADWLDIFNTNLFALANLTKEILPNLQSSKGNKCIVNIASVKGFNPTVGRVAYASSKAAVINLTAGLAKELSPLIRVNCIAPGFVSTDMTKETWSNRIQKQVDTILLKRMGKPEEIAETVMFFASNKASYITGQTIFVDGGFTIKND